MPKGATRNLASSARKRALRSRASSERCVGSFFA